MAHDRDMLRSLAFLSQLRTMPPAVETAWDWWERSWPRPEVPTLSTGMAALDAALKTQLRPIEVCGATGTGKTTLLQTIAARAVLNGARVLYFCPSSQSGNVVRFATILQSLLWKECTADWEARLCEGLQRIHMCVQDQGTWLPILETLPQQLSNQTDPMLWLFDDWDVLSPREVRQVEYVWAAVPSLRLVATAKQKTRHLLPLQRVQLERVEGAAAEYRATVLRDSDATPPSSVPYSISWTCGILS